MAKWRTKLVNVVLWSENQNGTYTVSAPNSNKSWTVPELFHKKGTGDTTSRSQDASTHSQDTSRSQDASTHSQDTSRSQDASTHSQDTKRKRKGTGETTEPPDAEERK